MAKLKINLLQKQVDILKNLPEQGMGYQVVDITLKNGMTLNGKVVLNSMYLQIEDNEKIDPNEIEAIQLHKN
ncbi:MAG TPA: hypothetical protein VMX13_00480 [Sedimentisphaerales bacterium]|nr:hypothetical protein [Sedimentisphaerales bacterium]